MTHHRSNSTKGAQAFTLPEVLLAMVLLAIGLTSVLMLFPLGARMQVDAVNDTSGRLYAESAFAALHANANYMASGGSPVIVAPAVPDPNNPAGLTIIPAATASLPIVPPPSGNYLYRACFWQTSPGHFSAAVFAFNAASGNNDLSNPPLLGAVANANNGGLTQLNIAVGPDFSPDQTILVQDITLPSLPVFIERVVDITGGVTVSPAMPVVAGDKILLIYLPQRALAAATGSIR